MLTFFDENKYFLGSLCRNGHDWNNTKQSLRYVNNVDKRCFVCEQARNKRKRKRLNSIEENERKRKNYHDNIERSREGKRRNTKRWRENNPDKVLEERLKYKIWQKSPNGKASRRRRAKKYAQSPDGKLTIKRHYFKRRANKKQAHSLPFTKEEIETLFQKFDNSCAYCGSKENLSIDHVIPLSRGGCDVLGNFLPSCKPCNSSKFVHNIETWFKSQSFYCPKRWNKILKLLGKEVCRGQLTLF